MKLLLYLFIVALAGCSTSTEPLQKSHAIGLVAATPRLTKEQAIGLAVSFAFPPRKYDVSELTDHHLNPENFRNPDAYCDLLNGRLIWSVYFTDRKAEILVPGINTFVVEVDDKTSKSYFGLNM